MMPFDANLNARLVKLGAQARLVELELEKEQIQRILNDGSPVGAQPDDMSMEAARDYVNKVLTGRVHWTKRPENAAKVMAMIKKGRRTKRSRNGG